MRNQWNSSEAAAFGGTLGPRVYSSRLIGRDPSLVLHGGGNTSVKVVEKSIFGEDEAILYVKGSGWDLASIEPEGFSPCRISHLHRLSRLGSMTDLRMAAELRGSMTNPSAPAPSVEAILHALLPAAYVDHTHADALISLSNTPGGQDRVREAFGGRVVVVPYVMPGFKLARLCAELIPAGLATGTIGIVLMSHGLVSFGDTAQASYGRMVELVTLAEEYLERKGAWRVDWPPSPPPKGPAAAELAAFRRELSSALGAPAIVSAHRDPKSTGFARRGDVAALSQQGPATPDHVIRTKRVPMVGRDLAAYRSAYEAYFTECSKGADPAPRMLDPAPRVVIDPDWGVLTAGRTAREASIAADLYGRTIDIIMRASALGGWRALSAREIFETEYWDLEQAKLRRPGPPAPFEGEVALVTGAASGIGRACAEVLLSRGAAVAGLDVNPAVRGVREGPEYLGIVCDLTVEGQVASAVTEAVRAFGGLDMLVLNAGIFGQGRPVAEIDTESWRRVMGTNLDATFFMMRACHPILRLSPNGGRAVVVGSKNVPAPGPGAAAYSASKAAVNQLARVAALEWGREGIRINSVHPNMVFDTGLWSPEVLESRARQYGLTVEDYKSRNVLGVDVTSRDVAELVADMCGPAFAKTTGAQVPVDGGNERVI